MKLLKIGLFAMTAFATAVGASAPAFAGYGHGRGVSVHVGKPYYHPVGYRRFNRGYHRGYYRGYRRGFRGGYYGRRPYRRGIRGGEAAAIALGVVGGAIILNEVIENDRRRDAYYRDRRYAEERYRRYDPRYDDYYYERGARRAPRDERFEEDFDDGFEDEAPRARRDRVPSRGGEGAAEEFRDFDRDDRRFEDRDDRAFEEFDDERFENDRGDDRRPQDRAPDAAPTEPVEEDPLDDELLGGEQVIAFAVDRAFRDCTDEARAAAARDGQFIAMPSRPGRVTPLQGGGVRMTADLTAQNQRGAQFLRTLTCEADARRITFLQLS
ncbi:MAG: hypothetical protein AAGJ87_07055 [Pseudomonadota bacterium]